jgi:hypothetical protein
VRRDLLVRPEPSVGHVVHLPARTAAAAGKGRRGYRALRWRSQILRPVNDQR